MRVILGRAKAIWKHRPTQGLAFVLKNLAVAYRKRHRLGCRGLSAGTGNEKEFGSTALVAYVLNDLAVLYADQAAREAEALYDRALAIEGKRGTIRMSKVLGNLAELREQQNHLQMVRFSSRALATQEKKVRSNNPT
jgi:hypothetical protein